MNPPPGARWPWREALALALWLLLTIAWRPLALPDEGRYAGVALEMLHGDALVPTLAGLPFFHKPPLLYWVDMGALRVFGVNAFVARLGPALFGWLLGIALLLHLRRWHGPAVARAGLVMLATAPLFFGGAQYVNHDIGVAACISAALLALLRALDERQAGNSRGALAWLVAGWALCGLGVLAKGLIGAVLPALVLLPWLAAQRRWRDLAWLAHPFGLSAFGAVVAPWLWLMQSRYPGFFDYFIVEQHFRRYAGTTFNNRQPWWFFVAVLPLLLLPWSLWAGGALRRAARLQPQWPAPHNAFYLWWLVVVVGFFSLPASKLVGYVMPALVPAIALLAQRAVARPRLWQTSAAGAALVCVAAIGALAWQAPKATRALAAVLAQRLQPGDRVAFVERYFYDVPFYAGLVAPPVVISDWQDPALPLHDDWRKELSDAARFAPDQGSAVLWPWRRVPELGCGSAAWIVVAPELLPRLQALPGLSRLVDGPNALLLHVAARTCAAAPPAP